MDGGRDRD